MICWAALAKAGGPHYV